ncbi:MAG: M23 family metallopeptidase [Microbacterium sp.]
MTEHDTPDAASEGAAPEVATRTGGKLARRDVRRIERELRRGSGARLRPGRTLGTAVAVFALLAGFAIPAYAAVKPELQTLSLQDAAESEAQSVAVSADVQSAALTGSNYSATSPEQIAEQKAAEEAAAAAALAAERAQEAAAAAAANQSSSSDDSTSSEGSSASSTDDYSPSAEIDGAVCPLPAGSYRFERTVTPGGHEGLDLSTYGASPPIYAVKGGTVIQSSENTGGWGVMIEIDHGDGTTTLYGHMQYGSRLVEVGDTVTAGQQIGTVGSTGYSTGNHLHLELRIDGVIVDPLLYLPIPV